MIFLEIYIHSRACKDLKYLCSFKSCNIIVYLSQAFLFQVTWNENFNPILLLFQVLLLSIQDLDEFLLTMDTKSLRELLY